MPAVFLATVPATLATQAYSRDAERRADAHAAQLLHRSGIAPAAMAVFFERMLEEETKDEGGTKGKRQDKGAGASQEAEGQDAEERSVSLPIAIASHPDHAERIRYFREWQPDDGTR